MLESDFLELLARQCMKEVKSAEGLAELQCPLGMYKCMCGQPTCTMSFATYGRKMLPYEWRSHLQAVHLNDSRVLLNLVEDLESEALSLWAMLPAAERVYIEAPSAPAPAPPAKQHEGGTQDEEVSTHPPPIHGNRTSQQAPPLLSPSLSCPFHCGCEHLVPGADYAKHCLTHLAELQTLAAVLDTLVLRAYTRQCCPFKDFATIGESLAPGPCRQKPKGGDWWAHMHESHLIDALATTMHLFRRGERTLEAAAVAAKNMGAIQLRCPMPRCQSHTPTAVKLVAHLVGHLRPLHPENDTAHLLCARAKDMSCVGRAGATAAKQPFIAAGPAKNSKHGQVHRGLPGRNEQHMSYVVIRGNEGIKPLYFKHKPAEERFQDERLRQMQQSKKQPQRPGDKQEAGKQAPGGSCRMWCPFPHCCTAPAAPSLEQPIHPIQLPNAANTDQTIQSFQTPAELEEHAFSSHSAELLLAAQQFTCTAHTDSRTGMLVCPVRSGSSPHTRLRREHAPAAGLSKPLARRHNTAAAGHRLSSHSGCQEDSPQQQPEAGAVQQADGHSMYHAHAKDLVQHVYAQHAALAMVAAALAKGLVKVAAANRGQPDKESCPLCPPRSPTAAQLLDEAPVLGHLLKKHSSQLLQVFHCLQILASGRDASSARSGQCLLQCGVSGIEGEALGAMLHAAEDHALQVVELSAGAAAEAVPGSRQSKSSTTPKREPLANLHIPPSLVGHAPAHLAMGPPPLSPAEQLASRDQGVQAYRVHVPALTREYMLKAYGRPRKAPVKRTADASVAARPRTSTTSVMAQPLTSEACTWTLPEEGASPALQLKRPPSACGAPAAAAPIVAQGHLSLSGVQDGPPVAVPASAATTPVVAERMLACDPRQPAQGPLAPPAAAQPHSSQATADIPPLQQDSSQHGGPGLQGPAQPHSHAASHTAPAPAAPSPPLLPPAAPSPPLLPPAAPQPEKATSGPNREQKAAPLSGAVLAAAVAPVSAGGKPQVDPSSSISASLNGPLTPNGSAPALAVPSPLATSPQALPARPQPPLPSAPQPFMHLAIEHDQRVQLPPEEDDFNSTLGSGYGGTPRDGEGQASLENTGSTIVMPALSTHPERQEEATGESPGPAAAGSSPEDGVHGAPGPEPSFGEGKHPARVLTAAASDVNLASAAKQERFGAPSPAATAKAASPPSKSAGREESKPAAATTSPAISSRAANPLTKSAGREESKPAAATTSPAITSRAASPLSKSAGREESKPAAATNSPAIPSRAASPLSKSAGREESKPVAATTSPAIPSRAGSPLSKSAGREESKPAAATTSPAISSRAASPLSKSAGREESKPAAATSPAIPSRAASPLSKSAGREESKPAAATTSPAIPSRAASPLSKSAGREESKASAAPSQAATPRAASPLSKSANREESKPSAVPSQAATPRAASSLSDSAAREKDEPSAPPSQAATPRAASSLSDSAAREKDEPSAPPSRAAIARPGALLKLQVKNKEEDVDEEEDIKEESVDYVSDD